RASSDVWGAISSGGDLGATGWRFDGDERLVEASSTDWTIVRRPDWWMAALPSITRLKLTPCPKVLGRCDTPIWPLFCLMRRIKTNISRRSWASRRDRRLTRQFGAPAFYCAWSRVDRENSMSSGAVSSGFWGYRQSYRCAAGRRSALRDGFR